MFPFSNQCGLMRRNIITHIKLHIYAVLRERFNNNNNNKKQKLHTELHYSRKPDIIPSTALSHVHSSDCVSSLCSIATNILVSRVKKWEFRFSHFKPN